MDTYYYLIAYPTEAVIASQLEPGTFASYMALGERKGSAEELMFFELNKECIKRSFDFEYAVKNCVQHRDGKPKNSVYLSAYRALELIQPQDLGVLRLVTRDGRSLKLCKSESGYVERDLSNGCALYQELCPTHPLVVSALAPKAFSKFIVSESSKLNIPAFFFADITMPNLQDDYNTGNIGGFFDNIIGHLRSCIKSVGDNTNKSSKVVNRSSIMKFSYQVVGSGFFVGFTNDELVYYPMPTRKELKKDKDMYDWGKSSLIF